MLVHGIGHLQDYKHAVVIHNTQGYKESVTCVHVVSPLAMNTVLLLVDEIFSATLLLSTVSAETPTGTCYIG